jgi:hypothetical protein
MLDKELPTEAEFLAWESHPVTMLFRDRLEARLNDLKTLWASGAFTDQSQFGTAILNAKAIGRCEEITEMLDLTYEDIEGLFNE